MEDWFPPSLPFTSLLVYPGTGGTGSLERLEPAAEAQTKTWHGWQGADVTKTSISLIKLAIPLGKSDKSI